MEEWRAVLVDSTVLSMVNRNQVDLEDFYLDNEQQGIFLNSDFLEYRAIEISLSEFLILQKFVRMVTIT